MKGTQIQPRELTGEKENRVKTSIVIFEALEGGAQVRDYENRQRGRGSCRDRTGRKR